MSAELRNVNLILSAKRNCQGKGAKSCPGIQNGWIIANTALAEMLLIESAKDVSDSGAEDTQ